MRVLICSGRFYADTHTITHMLDLYTRTQTINVLIHGGHQTLGSTIENWARGIDVHVIRYPANWAVHGKYAETRRNLFMLKDSRPDVLLAFPGGEDTAECIKMARNYGVKVIEI
ncbi:SLOG family protein [Klebsiella aerogenes]